MGFVGTAQESDAHVMTDLQERLRALIFARKPIPDDLRHAFHHDRFATLTSYYEAERDGLICDRCGQRKNAGDFGCT